MTNIQPGTAAIRWQYQALRFETGREFEESGEHLLNQLGADGWEIAGFVRFERGRENGYRVIMKRPYSA